MKHEDKIRTITCSLALGGRPPTYTRRAWRVAYKRNSDIRSMWDIKIKWWYNTVDSGYPCLLSHGLHWHHRESWNLTGHYQQIKNWKPKSSKHSNQARTKLSTCPAAKGNMFRNIPGMTGVAPGSWPV